MKQFVIEFSYFVVDVIIKGEINYLWSIFFIDRMFYLSRKNFNGCFIIVIFMVIRKGMDFNILLDFYNRGFEVVIYIDMLFVIINIIILELEIKIE